MLDQVQHGRTVLVTNGGRAVARLLPVDELPGGLQELIAAGAATAAPQQGAFKLPPVTSGSQVDIGAAIAADRDQERW